MMGQKQYLHVVLSLTHTFNELERKKDRLWLPWKKNMSTSHGILKEQLWGWNEGASLLCFFLFHILFQGILSSKLPIDLNERTLHTKGPQHIALNTLYGDN